LIFCEKFNGKPPIVVYKSKCPKCGAINKCGMENGKGTCWCFSLPIAKIADGDHSNCYCQHCLEAQINDMSLIPK
jgi:hypothetical protein